MSERPGGDCGPSFDSYLTKSLLFPSPVDPVSR